MKNLEQDFEPFSGVSILQSTFALGVVLWIAIQYTINPKQAVAVVGYRKGLSKNTWWRHQMETFSALLALVRGIHRPPVNSPHKGQWREALAFSLICVWMNGWVNNREAGDLRRHRTHYVVTVMKRNMMTQNYRLARSRWRHDMEACCSTCVLWEEPIGH